MNPSRDERVQGEEFVVNLRPADRLASFDDPVSLDHRSTILSSICILRISTSKNGQALFL